MPKKIFSAIALVSIKTRKMVKLLRKSFDVSKMRLMFVLKLEMTVTSVILNFKLTPLPQANLQF